MSELKEAIYKGNMIKAKAEATAKAAAETVKEAVGGNQ